MTAIIFWVADTMAQQKPNIVFILSDDAGYADFSFQSDRLVPTPNIDRIAHEGVKFTNAYVTSAVCSPSRAGILTGVNQAEFGNVYNFIQGQKYNIDKEQFGIPVNVKLVGDYLKPLGYKTGIIGKWHEGFSERFQPNQRGFDYFWGFLWGSNQYFPGKALNVLENGRPVPSDSIPYMTDAIADKAIAFIDKNKAAPFFLYVAFNAVHAPQQGKPEDLALFKDKFSDHNRLENAAMTHNLDENVGRILQELEKTNLLNNTLLIFANDNGGELPHLHASNFPLRGGKSDVYEGGIRIPMAARLPGVIKAGTVSNNVVSTLDFVPTFIQVAGGPKKVKGLVGLNLITEAQANAKYTRTLYWYVGKNEGAMRYGNWKLVCHANKSPELYDLSQDIHEDHDLFATNKETGEKLLATYKKWVQTLPAMNYYPLNPDAKE
jgi:arylsulfatase A-like enzyme